MTQPPTTSSLLRFGDRSAGVLALQQRLTELGYWLGTPDALFGDATRQAVYALQKAAGLERDAVVGPATAAAAARGVVPRPRSTTGRVVEIDLERNLLLLVTDGRLVATLNTSTGGGFVYLSQGRAEVAATPRGTFTVFRQVDGLVISPLGELWRPKFFTGGYAIHGSAFVPPYPASHGCVRVSFAAIDWIWSAGLMPIGTAVWVY